MSDLSKRLIYSLSSIVVIVLLIIFSKFLVMELVVSLMIAAVAGVAVWEYAQLAHAKDLQPASYLMLLVAVLEVLAIYISIRFLHWPLLPLLILFAGLITFFLAHFKDPSKALVHIALQFFGICYIAVPLGMMLGILFVTSNKFPSIDGRWWLFYLIFVTKITDIGAYFVGRLWGKYPLAPVLSPNKTIEGSIAGLACSILLSLIFFLLGHTFASQGFPMTFMQAIWLGACLSLLGQIGDLAESLFKRDAYVKDSNALPGIGGVLDMVDSLLLTTPVVYFFLRSVAL